MLRFIKKSCLKFILLLSLLTIYQESHSWVPRRFAREAFDLTARIASRALAGTSSQRLFSNHAGEPSSSRPTYPKPSILARFPIAEPGNLFAPLQNLSRLHALMAGKEDRCTQYVYTEQQASSLYDQLRQAFRDPNIDLKETIQRTYGRTLFVVRLTDEYPMVENWERTKGLQVVFDASRSDVALNLSSPLSPQKKKRADRTFDLLGLNKLHALRIIVDPQGSIIPHEYADWGKRILAARNLKHLVVSPKKLRGAGDYVEFSSYMRDSLANIVDESHSIVDIRFTAAVSPQQIFDIEPSMVTIGNIFRLYVPNEDDGTYDDLCTNLRDDMKKGIVRFSSMSLPRIKSIMPLQKI